MVNGRLKVDSSRGSRPRSEQEMLSRAGEHNDRYARQSYQRWQQGRGEGTLVPAAGRWPTVGARASKSVNPRFGLCFFFSFFWQPK